MLWCLADFVCKGMEGLGESLKRKICYENNIFLDNFDSSFEKL